MKHTFDSVLIMHATQHWDGLVVNTGFIGTAKRLMRSAGLPLMGRLTVSNVNLMSAMEQPDSVALWMTPATFI